MTKKMATLCSNCVIGLPITDPSPRLSAFVLLRSIQIIVSGAGFLTCFTDDKTPPKGSWKLRMTTSTLVAVAAVQSLSGV